MSLIKCAECGAQVSDKAAACPSCGAKPRRKTSPFVLAFLAVFGVVLVFALASGNGSRDAAILEARKAECQKAILSGIGHSTAGYADKAAYDAEVRDKCKGLALNGKPLTP